MNILIFPSGSAVAQEIYDSLKYIKNVTIFGTDVDHSNYSSIYFENYIPGCPFVKNENETISFLQNIITCNNIHYIFPAFDNVLEFLKKNEKSFTSKIISPELNTIQICNSKLITYNKLKTVIPTPIMYDKINITVNHYPLYVKPITGYGSRNHSIIHNKNDMERVDTT